MFTSSFCSKSLSPGFFPFTVVSYIFSFSSVCIAFIPSFCDWAQSFLWAPWLPVFWTLHLIGCLSPHHLVLFLEFLSVLSFVPYFFVSTHLLHCKMWSLRYSPEWSNPLPDVVALYVGEGSEREQCLLLACWLSSHFPLLPSLPAGRLWPFRCWFPGAWARVCSRILWASPMDSCDTDSFSHCHNPHRFLQPEILRVCFPTLECWVAWFVSLLNCSFWLIRTWTWDILCASHHLAFCPLCPSFLSPLFLPVWINVPSQLLDC